MFIQLNKLSNERVKTVYNELNQEFDNQNFEESNGECLKDWILENELTYEDWIFEEDPVPILVNLDNILYIQPCPSCINGWLEGVSDKELMPQVTRIGLRDGSKLIVMEQFEEICRQLSK